jgi:hypothetical protein
MFVYDSFDNINSVLTLVMGMVLIMFAIIIFLYEEIFNPKKRKINPIKKIKTAK